MPNPTRVAFQHPPLRTKTTSLLVVFSCLTSTVLSDFATAADRGNHWVRRKNTPPLELASARIENPPSERPSPRRTSVLPLALPPGVAHEGKRHWPLTDTPIGWRAGNTPIPFVLHLRETHDNVLVQKNISRLVTSLEKKNPDLLIGAEGAWGRVPLTRFERIADPDRRRAFADALLEEGLLTGEEHAVAAGLVRRPLWGVEDERLHTAHVISQTNTRRFAPTILSDLKRQRAVLEGTLRIALSKKYRDHRAATATPSTERFNLTDRIKALMSGIPVEERNHFPLLTALLTVQDARKTTVGPPNDSPGTEGIAELSEILRRVQKALADLSHTSMDDFFRELNRLEQTVGDRLLANESPGARAALARERWLDRLIGLWSLTLTPEQWADYKAFRDRAPDPLGPRERAKRRHPEAFYELAERRDAAMAENLQNLLEEAPVPAAVLVTGGFHGAGIETRLEKAGVTYAALYVESQDRSPSLRPASALIAPTAEQAARMAQIAERLLTRAEAAPFRSHSRPAPWILGLVGLVGLALAGPALAVDLAGAWPGAGWEGPLTTVAGWAGVTVALDDNGRLLSWRSRLQDWFPPRKRTPPPPPDEEAARALAAQWAGLAPGERAKRTRRSIVESPPLAAGALAHLAESDRRDLLTELDPKFRGDLLHGLEDWARAHLRRKWKRWSALNERLLATLRSPAPGWGEKKAALEKTIRDEIAEMGIVHRDLLALRWAHASPIPKDRPPKENPINVAADVFARAMGTRQKLLEGISTASSADAAAATMGAHGSALAADTADFIKQTHALDADRLSSPLVPEVYRGWSDVVARLGADNLKPEFLFRASDNGDVLAAANAGEEIQSALDAGWLDIVPPESLTAEETSPFSASLDVWEAHGLHPVPSKWGLAVWPNDLTKMNFAVPLAARLAAAEHPRRLYRLRTARLFGDHTRQTEVSKALAQLLRHLGEQGHAVLLMDMDIYQTEKQDVLQRAMNEWKKLPAPPPVIGVCTELTHKMRLETKTRDLFDPVVTSNDTDAIDRWTLSERLELLSERLRFRIPWTDDPARTLMERARAFTGFAWGDFTARWVDRAVTRSWRRLLRARDSQDPFELTDADLEIILRDRPPEHLRPLRDRIANVLPRLTDAQRRDLLREFNDMANPSLSRQEAQKIRLWIEEFIEIHSLPAAAAVLGGGEVRNIAPALFERAQSVFARSHFGMDAVVRQVEGILTKIIQSERRAIVPESDYTCLIGPPGVGKTSILLLIGEALGRPVKIISGTKIQTEEDLKGFLRTYVNSHSGELATALRAGPPEERVRNPIVVIDEVDKIPPAIQAILLQVLDAAQNSHFEDFYLGEIDLSGVEFVLTGNDAGRIIEPLKNRMRIETLKGYTEAEKIQIAARFMLPKLLAEWGLRDALVFPRAGDALAHLIRLHDREQGVRELERLLERVVLFAAKRWALNGRRAPVTVDADLIDACLTTPTRPRLPLSAEDTVGLAHFPAVNGFAFALETRRDTSGKIDDSRRDHDGTDGETADSSSEVHSPPLRWFERLWRRLRHDDGAPRLPAAGDPHTAPALKEILDLAGRLVGAQLPEEWVIAAPRSGTPPDPAAGLAAVVSLVSAETDRPVKRETVFLGALDNRGGLLPAPDLDRRLFGAIDAGAVEVVLPHAQEAEVRALAAGVVGLRGPLLTPGPDGTAELSIPLPGPSIFANDQDPTWLEFLRRARQRPEHRPGADGFLTFSGPVSALRALARESLDATAEPQTLYVLVDRWDRAVPFAFREPGEAPRVRKSARYADSVKVLIPQESAPPTTAPDVGGQADSEIAADRTVLFMNDNYRRRMIVEPATRIADDLFETVVENYDPTKVASAEAVLRSALVHNPAVAARFFIRMIDVWITGDKMSPAQRRAIMEIFGTLSPDTVGSMLLASAQFGADTLLLRIRASAQGLQKALAAPGNKTAALGALTDLRLAFHKAGGDGDLPHPIDELARRLNAWDPARSPAAPADLAQWADAVARRALLFVNDIEQAQRAPLVGNEPAAREDLKIRFPDYANQPLHELFELNRRGVDDLTETLGVYTAGRLLEDMEDLGFVTEHRPLAPLSSPEDDLLDPVLRGAGRAVADQAATSALRHTVLLSCPDPLRAAFPDYLARYLWRDGLPRRVLRLNTLNLQMANTEFADDTAFAWRRMQRVIQSAARQGNCLLVIDLDEFQKNVPPARHTIDLGRILAVANDSAKPLPLVFVGSEAAHLRFQESVTAYGDQVVAFSLADVPPGAVLRAQVGQVERARERPILAAGVLARIVQQIHDRALGLRGAQRLIDRLSALPAPADLETFQREREKMDTEDQRGSKDLSIEQRFERESYRLPPAVRAQAEKFLGLWVASSGDEAAKLEHRLRLILDFPYPRVPSAEQKARDAQNLLGDLPDTLRRLRQTLDAEFFGMDEVKDRIEDFVTRTLLSRAAGSPPRGKGLLLVGPPGTAKTTIVLAISEALGIPMTVVPCGAVKDAQYFVGFDSGFLGSKIGKLCEAAIRMGVPNGIYLLDEIEKMRPNESGQHPGDVFLQILDPKQNTRVREKFLGVDTDYSQNLFIATANGLDGIPAPLLDRFDVVALTGYNKSAKVAIGQKLVRRLIQKWRIEEDVRTPDLPGVIAVAVEETHAQEKGVRQLGKALNAVFKAALTEKFKSGLDTPIVVTPDFARRALRAAPLGTTEDRPLWAVGRVQGLAVMSGEGEEGQVLEIEADLLTAPHAESPLRVVAAGRAQALMDFSQQSALPAALGWMERHGGPTVNTFQGKRIGLLVLPWHIPKDGDSAGTAFALAMLSALTGRPLRQDFAVTGAISRGGKIQLVGGIADKVTKAQQVAKTIFLPRENENDLLAHLLKSPDQIHFVESRRPGGDWERALYVMPRAFTNAGLPALAVDRFVRDAKNAGLATLYDPAMKSNEWIKIAGAPEAIESFFQNHRGVLETPPLHVLADRLEDVVERVLGDASDAPPDPPSSPSSGGSDSSIGSAVATSAPGLTPGIDPDSARIPVQSAFKGALAIAGVFFTPWKHVQSATSLTQGPKTGADHNQRVRESLALLNPLVKIARPEWAESIKIQLAGWKPNESNTPETMASIREQLETAIFSHPHREHQANALVAITLLEQKPEARPRPDSSAVPVLTLDWNSVLSSEGKGLLRIAETFLAESPRARVVLAGSPNQKSAMESSLTAGPLASHTSRVLILNTLPASGSVNTEEIKEWIRERLSASGVLGEGGLRFRLGATPDQAQRWTGLLQSLLVFSREVVVPAAVWNQMKPHLQGDPGVDNPDGSHTLPAREYSLADLLKSIAEDVVIQTQA